MCYNISYRCWDAVLSVSKILEQDALILTAWFSPNLPMYSNRNPLDSPCDLVPSQLAEAGIQYGFECHMCIFVGCMFGR